VRLYFRPKTPMQYVNEGVRPAVWVENGAHCPVPVIMLFDAMSILGRESTEFSDGNLRMGRATVGADADFFEKIPFDLVYHDGAIGDNEDKRSIIFHRHAEVIVPDELDLEPLRYVVCRSQAEQETLLHLLGEEGREKWAARTIMKANLNYRRWNFVEQVDLVEAGIVAFRFNRSERGPGPFRIEGYADSAETGPRSFTRDDFVVPEDSKLRVRLRVPAQRVVVELRLDGALVFKNELKMPGTSRPV
jgi:hypothetical protein